MTVSAQATIEPNLKWGKPTQQELTMTEYAADEDADAVELFRDVNVYYAFINGDFRVINNVKCRLKVLKPEGINNVKCRLKVLKPEGKHVADGEILIWRNSSNDTHEVVRALKATAYNLENGKVVKTKMESSSVHEEELDTNSTPTTNC